MFTLQVIQEQVEYDEMDLVLIFSRKIWVTAYFFCNLFVTRTANGTRDYVKRMARKLVHSRPERSWMSVCQMVVDFRAFSSEVTVRTGVHGFTPCLPQLP